MKHLFEKPRIGTNPSCAAIRPPTQVQLSYLYAAAHHGSHRPGSVWPRYQDDYFATPTKRAPLNLPSGPMSGA